MDICILDEFSDDDIYKHFLADDFNVKAVTSAAVQLVAVTEHLAKLSAGISLLDKELHNQVANHYKDLLSQATEIETLEGVLHIVHGRIQTLLTSTDRLRRNVGDPYEAVSRQTKMLVRLHVTCDLLRRSIRVMQLCRRLEKQISGNTGELVKAAQCLNEIDYLSDGVDLCGLQVIENDLLLVKRARESVHSQANVLLLKGVESQNRVEVSTSLQVFYSLHIMPITVHEFFNKKKDEILKHTQQALDVKLLSFHSRGNAQKIHGPGRAAIPLAGNSAACRASLWKNMRELMSHICCAFNQIQHLQEVLSKKRDPVSHVRYIDELRLEGCYDLVQELWEAVTNTLTDQFSHAAEESTFIKQEFEVEFPELLRMFNELLKNLQHNGCQFKIDKQDSSHKDSSVKLSNKQEENMSEDWKSPDKALRYALGPFESAYLSRCLSRLTDSVNVVYTGEGQDAPTSEDIVGIVKAIKSELSAASIDTLLLEKVARNVAETIHFVVEKCQYMVCTDGLAVQVIDVPNSSQTLNARVVHLLYLFQTELMAILECRTLSSAASSVIKDSLQSAVSLMHIAVEPLLQSVSSAIEAIIVTMHREDFFSIQIFDDTSKMPDAPCSLYMKELQHFIGRSQNDYFSLYPDCNVVIKGIQDLASRAVELFVRHASFVYPLNEGGKMRLAADCAQMEMAVTPFCQRIGDLGKSYRLLRSFRPLLFQTSIHIAQSPAVGDIVPYSIALQLLFARAPRELHAHHVVAGWSLDEYSHWLDKNQSEKNRLLLLKGTLEKYVTWINQRQDKEFCPIYPVIVELLQKGLHSST